MILIALSLTLTALWLILSPWNSTTTEFVLFLSIALLLFGLIIALIKRRTIAITNSLFLLIGMLVAYFIYPQYLSEYRQIQHHLPLQIESEFTILRNHSPTSTTIEITQVRMIQAPEDTDLSSPLSEMLRDAEVTLYNIAPEIKATLQEGARYSAILDIKPRIIRNIPGNRERILSYLARKTIGYGRLKTDPILISPPSTISQLRSNIASYLSLNYNNSGYLSALSVGKTDELTQYDWQALRKTGTIHLVSISGLHLSLTAFYAFILFRILFGLLQVRSVEPFRLAAVLAIIVAWNYALLAGMSLPTIRAAIMFSVAMLTLIINRPIFSLHSVALALCIILLSMPLALLTAGFWLSFVAVVTLTLSTRLFQSPIKALLLTQLVLSLLLIPLTASFFGEISLISPFINLIAIPWTSVMIMPALLVGIIFYLITPIFAHPFLLIADQGVTVLKYLIMQSAHLPYASIDVQQIPLFIAVLITLSLLILLYLFPVLRHTISRLSGLQYRFYLKKNASSQYSIIQLNSKIVTISIAVMIAVMITIIISLHLFFSDIDKTILSNTLFQRGSIQQYQLVTNHSHSHEKQLTETDQSDHDNSTTTTTTDLQFSMYQLPVGEGLSFLLVMPDFTLLFDTGNRFRQFDAGKNIIHPTLRHLNITHIDALILSKHNQQHIGGTQSVLTAYPNTPVWTLPSLQSYINNAGNCRQLQAVNPHYTIKPLSMIQSSCAFHLTLYGMIDLYLIADIEDHEWSATRQYIELTQQQAPERQIVFLYPNQGRRYFPIHSLFDLPGDTTSHSSSSNRSSNQFTHNIPTLNKPTVESTVDPDHQPMILFSTRVMNAKIEAIMKRYQQPIYNSYQSTISLLFNYTNKKAKSLLELRLEDYRDQYRYYWLQVAE
ncbi:hypothetical protein DC083_06240 [Ignatzschineria ureiclastica]|uniref:ComEC/Rec2-related protein domain-containing protein n=1 Tax=Ignatzschineria ureiclastica TaxID=472582 RepID=A0A2U2ADH9_9GAMM|nr:ComEC/Rec2 family competence protein [Ignatzschineria ureiclastica]PWD80714.1 hypothetical protein DC083_06240 [Ignatzschineria ureiclastica]